MKKKLKNKQNILFGVLNLVQGLLVGALPVLVPSRADIFNWIFGAAAILMLLAGPALIFAGKWGARLAAAACLVHWIIGLATAALTFFSASCIYGIYGHQGKSLGAIGFVIVIVIMIVFWLIPGHELHYLRNQFKQNFKFKTVSKSKISGSKDQ